MRLYVSFCFVNRYLSSSSRLCYLSQKPFCCDWFLHCQLLHKVKMQGLTVIYIIRGAVGVWLVIFTPNKPSNETNSFQFFPRSIKDRGSHQLFLRTVRSFSQNTQSRFKHNFEHFLSLWRFSKSFLCSWLGHSNWLADTIPYWTSSRFRWNSAKLSLQSHKIQ